jgi:hypothetical protein
MRKGGTDITPERARAQENLNLESLLEEVTPKAHGTSPLSVAVSGAPRKSDPL